MFLYTDVKKLGGLAFLTRLRSMRQPQGGLAFLQQIQIKNEIQLIIFSSVPKNWQLVTSNW